MPNPPIDPDQPEPSSSGSAGLAAAQRTAREKLGDFTATTRVAVISLLAIGIGAVSAAVALALLRLIGFFTNLFFFGRLSFSDASPADNNLGVFIILIPIVGALIIGVMARYGSEKIRGHGIPEAIEAILINGSRVEPKVAILKPVSSAISIGSGGPFGAEGPIIMTGGAVGSMLAQLLHLTSSERKTLLVAGAAGGMSATFAAPIAAVLLAVELLLFEWKPRSLVPVALASATAAILRRYLIGAGPLFPTPPHAEFIGPAGFAACVLIGVLAAGLSMVLTTGVYAAEDAFHALPIHWMWWPAIGGLAIGIGGLIFPEALGVGYDNIGALLRGEATTRLIVGILIVKSLIWIISLGSGTSGGVLAPLLMMGGALGAAAGTFLPNEGAGFWPLIAVAAILGGTMRAPFTAAIFALELTRDVNALLPLLIAVTVAHGVTSIALKRSILTEKISRRGFHVSREYAIDPLEILFVREVMRTNVAAVPLLTPLVDVDPERDNGSGSHEQRLYPVVDEARRLVGVVPRSALRTGHPDGLVAGDVMLREPVVAFPDEPLRIIVERMAETGLTRFPVVDRDRAGEVLGMISLHDLLKARVRNLEAERRRERVLPASFFIPGVARRSRVSS